MAGEQGVLTGLMVQCSWCLTYQTGTLPLSGQAVGVGRVAHSFTDRPCWNAVRGV